LDDFDFTFNRGIEMKRILIFSHAPFAPSGYGQITQDLCIELKKLEYEVACVAIDHHNSMVFHGDIPVFPTRPSHDAWADDLYYWAENINADLIIQLFDAWVLREQWIKEDNIPVLTYNPIDCLPAAKYYKDSTKGAKCHIAMSEFTIQEMRRARIAPIKYIPHGIYTSFFKELPNKEEIKAKHGFPKDSFIFGLVGTNLTARKNIPNQMLAFSKFVKRNPTSNAYLYIHSIASRQLVTSYDLYNIIDQLKLGGKVLMVNQMTSAMKNIDKVTMLELYNSFDVLLNCVLGEGFGIPIIEAQSCGVPCIVNDFSAMPWTMGAGGLSVKKGEPWLDPSSCGWQKIPDTNEIVRRMEDIYYDNALRNLLREKAKENARKYDWSILTPKWKDIIES